MSINRHVIKQIRSQVSQLLLFRSIFSVKKLLSGAVALPFEFLSRSGRAGFPWVVNFLVTRKCNLHCAMCSFDASKFSPDEKELTTREIKDFITYAARKKLHIFLSGGEPFLREDIFEIIESIKKAGLSYGICTNGTLLDEQKVGLLCKYPPAFIIFSLLGDKEIHDKITGLPGSFEALVSNIKSFTGSGHKIKIFINCAISQFNIRGLPKIARIADDLKVDMLRFEHLNFSPAVDLQKHALQWKEYFPGDSHAELSTYCNTAIAEDGFYEEIMKMRELQNRFKVPIYFKPALSSSEIKSWYSNNCLTKRKCFFTWRSLFIAPNGDVLPCQFLVYKLGNIREESLDRIWNNKKYKNFRVQLKRGLLPGCVRCCKL